MRIVVVLGGNALQRRGEPMTIERQRVNVATACRSLAPVAIEHELGNLLPLENPLATILTMTEVDPHDPAFANPTKFVGHVYNEQDALQLAAERNWTVRPDGTMWRRVVPSPIPRRIFESRPVEWLLQHDCVVICAGGGAVYLDWGMPDQRAVVAADPDSMRSLDLPAGSMGPKAEAAAALASATGMPCVIGALDELPAILAGEAGTRVDPDVPGLEVTRTPVPMTTGEAA
ncbi:MAG: hypothetical protein ACRDO2_01560 [Nocardioidaceae bacterium]